MESSGSDSRFIQERYEPEENQFKRISIPLVRRIYPQLIADKLVSVQPLTGPTGLAYYLRFRYSENKGSQPAEETFRNQVTIEEVKGTTGVAGS